MQTKDLLLLALKTSFESTLPLIENMGDAATVAPTPGGNHVHWLLGHLTYVDSRVLFEMLLDEPNPLDSWKPSFGPKSQPAPDAAGYPAFDEMLATVRDIRTRLVALLESTSEADLGRTPTNVRPGTEARFATWRHCFLMLSLHWQNHRGQVCDCRKAAGRDPLFM